VSEDHTQAMIEILGDCLDDLKSGREMVVGGHMRTNCKLEPHCDMGGRTLSHTYHGSYVTISYETSKRPAVKEEKHMYRGTFE